MGMQTTETDAPATDIRGLETDYDIRGELRGTDSARYFIGRTKGENPTDVAIALFTAPKGETNILSHFASDVQQLQRASHLGIPRVLDGRWLGNDTFAIISERVVGETLDELLERGEKFPNARTAMLLQEVSGVLDWARENGIVHRGVSPDTLYFERDTNRVRVSLIPTPIPISGVPDESGDARTIGMLAWAFLTGKPFAAGETRSLGEVSPNLATRVIEATDKMLRTKDHREAPDVGTFLGVIAAGDVLKQAEVEMAATKEEYDEQHQRELQKCEIQRQEVEQSAAEQAAMLAGEREEFTRMMADERAAMDAERAQMEALLEERKQRLAAVRAELDEQRMEMERRLAELEEYRLEVEKVRDDAITARESAKAATAKAMEAAAAHQAALKAAALTPVVGNEAIVAMPAIPEVEATKAPRLAKPPKAPKWSKMQSVDLEHTDNVEVSNGRPRWMIPAGIATLLLIMAVVVYGAMNRVDSAPDAIKLGSSTVIPTPPGATPRSNTVPRGGFLTQSAGGALAPKLATSPMTQGAIPTAAMVDTGTNATAAQAAAAAAQRMTQIQRDSAAGVAAARARRAAAARAESQRRRPTQQEIDSMNTPSQFWNTKPRPDSAVIRPLATSLPRLDSTFRRDSLPRPDSARRDTIRPRPDTGMARRR